MCMDAFLAGGVYLEDYDQGELRKRIKWRRDKLHVACARCFFLANNRWRRRVLCKGGLLFVPCANSPDEKLLGERWPVALRLCL